MAGDPSTNGATYDSPGQRPGYESSPHRALNGRRIRWNAPAGLVLLETVQLTAPSFSARPRPAGALHGGWIMAGDLSTNGATYDSPGQRPGNESSHHRALKGRPIGWTAPRRAPDVRHRATHDAAICCYTAPRWDVRRGAGSWLVNGD